MEDSSVLESQKTGDPEVKNRSNDDEMNTTTAEMQTTDMSVSNTLLGRRSRAPAEIYVTEEGDPSKRSKRTVEEVCDTVQELFWQNHEKLLSNNSYTLSEIRRYRGDVSFVAKLIDPRTFVLFPETYYLRGKVQKVKEILKTFPKKNGGYQEIIDQLITGKLDEKISDFNGEFWRIDDINEISFFKEVLLEALFMEDPSKIFEKLETQPSKTRKNEKVHIILENLRKFRNSQKPCIPSGELMLQINRVQEAFKTLSDLEEKYEYYILTKSYRAAFEFNQILFIYIITSFAGSKEAVDMLRNSLFNLEPLERQLKELYNWESRPITAYAFHCAHKKLAMNFLMKMRTPWVARNDFAQSVDLGTFTVPPSPLQEFFKGLEGTLEFPIDPFFISSISQKLQMLPKIQEKLEILDNRCKRMIIEEDHPLLVETCQIGTSFRWITDDKLVVLAVQENTEKAPNQDAPKSWPIQENEVMAHYKNTSRQGYMVLNNKDNGSQFLIFHSNNQAARDDRLLVGSVPKNSNGDFTFEEANPEWLQ